MEPKTGSSMRPVMAGAVAGVAASILVVSLVLGAGHSGAATVTPADAPSSDIGSSGIASPAPETTTTLAAATTTAVPAPPTTAPAPHPVAPAPQVPKAPAPLPPDAPLDQRVDNIDQRVGVLEATTTTSTSPLVTPSTRLPPPPPTR